MGSNCSSVREYSLSRQGMRGSRGMRHLVALHHSQEAQRMSAGHQRKFWSSGPLVFIVIELIAQLIARSLKWFLNLVFSFPTFKLWLPLERSFHVASLIKVFE